MKIGILGGGLTGLVLAYHLRDKEEREAVAKKGNMELRLLPKEAWSLGVRSTKRERKILCL